MTVSEKINAMVKTADNFLGYSRFDIGLNKSTEWCAEFISFVLRAGEEDDVTSISCNDMYKYMSNSPRWYEPDDFIRVGDIIFFNWYHTYDNGRPLDHVGIIVEVNGNIITYIDGNSDSTGLVRIHHMNINNLDFNSTYPDRYMRLVQDTETTENMHVNTEMKPENYHSITSNKDTYDLIRELQSQRDKLDEIINKLIQSMKK